ncbi:hypothetical protein [Flexithrix dorotheae]|uniref:hypothetical protein n=1 Tax=Flexithrix dorotheae TaxID=70993 RepID=UPI0003647FBA|nr:hypothetical protein [Flexithrix dorotheae]
MIQKLLLATILFFNFITPSSAQDSENQLRGIWENAEKQLQLTLSENNTYEFLLADGQKVLSKFSIDNGFLILEDPGKGVNLNYYIEELNEEKLQLLDNNGSPIQFERKLNTRKTTANISKNSNSTSLHNHYKQSGRYTLSENEVQAYVNFIEFVTGNAISNENKNKLIHDSEREFAINPRNILKETHSFHVKMRSAYYLKDPLQIASLKNSYAAQAHLHFEQNDMDYLSTVGKIVNDQNLVLAFDKQYNLLLTHTNLNHFIEYLLFLNNLQVIPEPVSKQEIELFKDRLIQDFSSLPLDMKKVVSYGTIIKNTIVENWENLSNKDKIIFSAKVNEQLKAKYMTGQTNATASSSKSYIEQKKEVVELSQNMWKLLQNYSLSDYNKHLDIITQLGGTRIYWEVSDF